MLRASYVTLVLLAVAGSVPATAGTLKCAADAAKVGNVCVDRYEASVWQIAHPGALIRGGHWLNGTGAGVFAVNAFDDPSDSGDSIGFRCAR